MIGVVFCIFYSYYTQTNILGAAFRYETILENKTCLSWGYDDREYDEAVKTNVIGRKQSNKLRILCCLSVTQRETPQKATIELNPDKRSSITTSIILYSFITPKKGAWTSPQNDFELRYWISRNRYPSEHGAHSIPLAQSEVCQQLLDGLHEIWFRLVLHGPQLYQRPLQLICRSGGGS